MAKVNFGVEFSVTEGGRKAPQYTIDSDLAGEVTLLDLVRFTKATLILVAANALSEEQANGFDKTPVVTVDGVQNKPVIDVKPFGSIVFTARADVGNLLEECYKQILEKSKVVTGQYKESNYVFYNGQQVAVDEGTFYDWLASVELTDRDIISFVNIQPYARKLETLGVTSNRYGAAPRTVKSRGAKGKAGGRTNAPNGVYYLVSRNLLRIYGKNARITFDLIPGARLAASVASKSQQQRISAAKFKTGKRPRKGYANYLYPSIQIRLNPGGFI